MTSKKPVFAGFFAFSTTRIPETALAGWGGRIRTAKLPFQKLPLKLREKLARFGPNIGPEIFARQSC
jgi:hypothetical protein